MKIMSSQLRGDNGTLYMGIRRQAGIRGVEMKNEVFAPDFKFSVVACGTENGIRWAVCESPVKPALNGYVELPEGHKWIGKSYSEMDVEVNGGLTYGKNGWIGFDTLHSGDYWTTEKGHSLSFPENPNKWDRLWTKELVIEETLKLVQQVHKNREKTAKDIEIEQLKARLIELGVEL